MKVQIGYVVLYLNDTEKGAKFWCDTFGFEVKNTVDAMGHKVITVGNAQGGTNFELVPLALMENNPYELNLGIPSICLEVEDLSAEHARLTEAGVNVTPIADHGGTNSFAVIDFEDNAFAIKQR